MRNKCGLNDIYLCSIVLLFLLHNKMRANYGLAHISGSSLIFYLSK